MKLHGLFQRFLTDFTVQTLDHFHFLLCSVVETKYTQDYAIRQSDLPGNLR